MQGYRPRTKSNHLVTIVKLKSATWPHPSIKIKSQHYYGFAQTPYPNRLYLLGYYYTMKGKALLCEHQFWGYLTLFFPTHPSNYPKKLRRKKKLPPQISPRLFSTSTFQISLKINHQSGFSSFHLLHNTICAPIACTRRLVHIYR